MNTNATEKNTNRFNVFHICPITELFNIVVGLMYINSTMWGHQSIVIIELFIRQCCRWDVSN